MIVGLLGFIGSGKGTAGDILKDAGFIPLSFAKSVKDVAAEMFDWPRHLLEGDTQHSREWREKPDAFWSKEFGEEFTPRTALQLMGTEVGREIFHDDFWVIKVKKFIEQNPQANYVITDCRFKNEKDFVHNMGGTLIEIERGPNPHWYDIAWRANSSNTPDTKEMDFMMYSSNIHESEWRWIGNDIDHTIVNNGTLEDLKQKIFSCLTKTYGPNTISELTQGVI